MLPAKSESLRLYENANVKSWRQMRDIITDNRKYMKATIHVTRRRILAAYLPVSDISRPFAALLHGSSNQRRWESHVVEEVENSRRHEAEETDANTASIVPVQRQPL
jgi:hypothetical protein